MGTRSLIAAPLVLAALLGCAGCAPGQGSNPVDDLTHVVDLIPWATSVADIATADQLTARIEEVRAGLSGLDIPEATRAALTAKLTALAADAQAHPADLKAHVAALAAIVDDVKAAIGQ